MTQKNINDLERVQKSAVRIINGKAYDSYTETLKDHETNREEGCNLSKICKKQFEARKFQTVVSQE